MVPRGDIANPDFYSEKEDAELRAALEKSEGSGELRSADAQIVNLRESFASFIGHDDDGQKAEHALRPESPLRATVTRRIGGRAEIGQLLKAYEEVFLPEVRTVLADEFDDNDNCVQKGIPYRGSYFRTLEKYNTATGFVDYLTKLHERMITEEESLEQQLKDKGEAEKARQEIEDARESRKAELIKHFDKADIEIVGLGTSKIILLRDFGTRIGHKLEENYVSYMNDEEQRDVSRALTKFRTRIMELYPDAKDREIIIEGIEGQEKEIERKLISLFREKIAHEPTPELVNEIAKTRDERDNISALLRTFLKTY